MASRGGETDKDPSEAASWEGHVCPWTSGGPRRRPICWPKHIPGDFSRTPPKAVSAKALFVLPSLHPVVSLQCTSLPPHASWLPLSPRPSVGPGVSGRAEWGAQGGDSWLGF